MLKQLAVGGVSALLLLIPGVSVQVNSTPEVEFASVAASTKPVVTITRPPLPTSSLMTQTVEFTATASTAVWYQCSLNAAAFQRCTSPHAITVPSYGSHTFRVRAIDTSFRVSVPAEVTFQVLQQTPPPPPPPSSPTRVIFHNLENGTSYPIQGTTFEISAAVAEQFSICAENVTPPVTFTSPIGTQTENLSPFCLQGDDGEEPNPVSLSVGTHTITIADQAHATPLALTMIVRGSSTPPPPPPPGTGPTSIIAATFPTIGDGKPISQLGLYWWRYWNFEEPFIDLTKNNDGRFQAVLNGGARISWEDLWAAGHIDKTTGYPKSFPPNGWFYEAGRARHGASFVPAGYAGTWVITWDGDADILFDTRNCTPPSVTTNCQTKINPNRVEATYDATNPDPGNYRIWRIGQSGFRNLKVYRKEHEALLTSGKIVNPRFLEHARRYKVLRFMDPQETSQGRPFRAGDFARFNYATWAPDWKKNYTKAPDAPSFPSFETIFRVAVETGTAAWVHVAGLPGAPTSFNNLVEPADASLWKEACRTNLSTILASSDWAAYMDEIVRGLIAANYPTNRMVYLEPWNEVWNWGGPWARMTHCSDGITNALGTNGAPGWAPRYGFGYLSAHAMVEFDRALVRAGRTQAWTLAMGSQMAWDAVTVAGLEGFKRYFADRNIDSRPWLRHVGIATASYYAGGFDPTSGAFPASGTTVHLAKIKEAIRAGTASATLERWYTDAPATAPGSFNWVIAQRTAHQSVAESYGAFFLGDYEGESHENIPQHLINDAEVVAWMESFITGSPGERVTTTWASRLKNQNQNAIIANYMSVLPRGPALRQSLGDVAVDPWYDGYYGDVTGRTRGLNSILR